MGQWLPLVRTQAAGELGVGGALTFHYNLMHFLNFVSCHSKNKQGNLKQTKSQTLLQINTWILLLFAGVAGNLHSGPNPRRTKEYE